MSMSKLSIRALEVFEVTARTGSLQATADEVGLSISSVSHHLARTEAALGLVLIDRTRRPMVLTAAGTNFLRRIEEGLRHLRMAGHESAIGGLAQTRALSLGIVDDFESRVAPALAVTLAQTMPRMRLTLKIEPSHRAVRLVRERRLDIAVATDPADGAEGLRDRVLLRDPFVLAVPRGAEHPGERYLEGRSGMPFLRFNPQHLIGRQIEAHLRRNDVTLENRHEIDSAQSIMALVASGNGWAITSVGAFLRAHRFQDEVALRPLPIAGFARYVSLFTQPDFSSDVAEAVAAITRRLIERETVAPAIERFPWLADALSVQG